MDKSTERKDGGFVLVWALLLMVVLLILGVSGIGTSIFESTMTANDALHKQSFFGADGGVNVASMLVEQNVSCALGFTPNWDGNTHAMITATDPKILVVGPTPKLDFWKNTQADARIPSSTTPLSRDAFFFYNAADNAGLTILPRTDIKVGGDPKVLPGGPMQMAAGYEGKAKGLPGGGATIDYHVYSQNINVRDSQSCVAIDWQHIVGFEGSCKF